MSATTNMFKNVPFLRDYLLALKKYRSPDWTLIGIVIALVVLGLMATYTTTVFMAQSGRYDIPANAFSGQLMAALIGLALCGLLAVMDYGLLRILAVPAALVCVAMLVGVVFTGNFVAGARRAFNNGSITPSEITKLVMIIYAATWLASRRNQVRSILLGLIPYSMFVGTVAAVVYAQPDFSTALIIVLSTAAMFVLAGASWRQVLLGLGVATLVFYLVVEVRGGHTSERWNTFIAGINGYDKMHLHLQLVMQALGYGGMFGTGFGFGVVKHRLPAVDTDSVIAAMGEELGMFGLFGIFALFGLLLWRCMRITRNADSSFGQLLVVGIVSWLYLQTMVNVLGNLQLLPLPGVPVPFLSRGGSSMVAVLAACGILISVSRGSVLSFTADENTFDDDESIGARTAGRDPGLRTTGARRNGATRDALRRRHSRSRTTRAQRSQVFDSESDSSNIVYVGRCVKRDIKPRASAPSRVTKFSSDQRSPVARVVRWKR